MILARHAMCKVEKNISICMFMCISVQRLLMHVIAALMPGLPYSLAVA